MRKQRRGSTDLEWISKYQHSDHHVDRQARKKLENNSDFPLGLPPTPSQHASSSSARRMKYDQEDSRPQRFLSCLSNSPRNEENQSLATTYRRRSNSVSMQPVYYEPLLTRNFPPVGQRRNSFVSSIVSSSTPASRRDSVVDYVPPFLSSTRSPRATSVPGHFDLSRLTNSCSSMSRSSFASPSLSSDPAPFRRSSLAPGFNYGFYDNNKRSSIYNNDNNKRSSIYNNDNNKRSSIYNNDNNKRSSIYNDNNKRSSIYNNDNNKRSPIYNNDYNKKSSVYNDNGGIMSKGRNYTGSYVSSYLLRPASIVRF